MKKLAMTILLACGLTSPALAQSSGPGMGFFSGGGGGAGQWTPAMQKQLNLSDHCSAQGGHPHAAFAN